MYPGSLYLSLDAFPDDLGRSTLRYQCTTQRCRRASGKISP
jgi:hypothetical protein